MRILSLFVENVKKLKAVEITPDGRVVTISGKHDAGKSTILDAIFWLLAGKKNIQADPIRHGQTEARISAKLGDKEVELLVERTLKRVGKNEYTTSVRVTKPNGDVPPGGPQEILDARVGELGFEPFAFARMKPAEQFEELRRISRLDVDIVELDAMNAADYATRTDVNRDAKAKRAQAAAIVVWAPLPAAPIDESELLDEIQEAANTNAAIERAKADRDREARSIEAEYESASRKALKAAELRAEANRLDAESKAVVATAEAAQRALEKAPNIPQPVDISAVRAKMNEAREINAAIASRERRKAIEAEAEALEKHSEYLTENMEARATAKRNAIASAQLPVPGLGFGDGIVTYEGVPFDQVGTATKTRVSIAIAMAANPELRLILVRDASLLDAETRAAVIAMAEERDYDVWFENVADPGPDGNYDGVTGVIIEDGSVRAK